MEVNYTIPGKLPTLNDIIRGTKHHWAVYANQKKEMTAYCAVMAPQVKFNQIQLTCTWFRQDRRTDPDNIAFGVKFILDGLVMAGVLKNDGWKQVKAIKHRFVIGEPKVEINIKEV